MRRHALGVIGGLFLVGWAVFLRDHQVLAASCLRIGMLLGALWLALPQLAELKTRFPPWMLAYLAAAALVVAVRSSLALHVLLLTAAIFVLQFFGWLLKPPPTAR